MDYLIAGDIFDSTKADKAKEYLLERGTNRILRIRELPVTLKKEERQPVEVWTRVMGYHRPVSEHNLGKQQEHLDRVHFKEPGSDREPHGLT